MDPEDLLAQLNDARKAGVELVGSLPLCARCREERRAGVVTGRAPARANRVQRDPEDGELLPVCTGHSLVGDVPFCDPTALERFATLCGLAPQGGS